MKDIWKSKLSKSLKIRLFIAACESVLLYGSETWTLIRAQEKRLDGTHLSSFNYDGLYCGGSK